MKKRGRECVRGEKRERGGKGEIDGGREGGREGTIQHFFGTRNLHTGTILYQYMVPCSCYSRSATMKLLSVHTANFTRSTFTTHTRSRPGI